MTETPTRYRNRPTEVDGLRFDSRAEARRYAELRLLEQAGEITELECQPSFLLVDGVMLDGRRKPAVRFVGDFAYREHGRLIVEDVKSPATSKDPVFRIKKHLMKALLGIEVQEVS